MDILGMVLGWNWQVQRTRRRWDRLREHALEKKGRVRAKALEKLDLVEDKVKMLEEQHLSRRDRVKTLREIEMELANINDLIEKGDAWLESPESSHVEHERQS
ncbi:MAG: hypothetical protein KAT35_00205 [Candidatus Aenigmarchaeota archaeon]|nr:hypothetical protein [Candidatus Aenigmarchaeota archaeon]